MLLALNQDLHRAAQRYREAVNAARAATLVPGRGETFLHCVAMLEEARLEVVRIVQGYSDEAQSLEPRAICAAVVALLSAPLPCPPESLPLKQTADETVLHARRAWAISQDNYAGGLPCDAVVILRTDFAGLQTAVVGSNLRTGEARRLLEIGWCGADSLDRMAGSAPSSHTQK